MRPVRLEPLPFGLDHYHSTTKSLRSLLKQSDQISYTHKNKGILLLIDTFDGQLITYGIHRYMLGMPQFTWHACHPYDPLLHLYQVVK